MCVLSGLTGGHGTQNGARPDRGIYRGPTNERGPEAGIFGAAARRLPGPHAQTGQEREKEEEREEMSVMKSLVIDSLHTTDVLQCKQ
jgi:hypothetical protein